MKLRFKKYDCVQCFFNKYLFYVFTFAIFHKYANERSNEFALKTRDLIVLVGTMLCILKITEYALNVNIA